MKESDIYVFPHEQNSKQVLKSIDDMTNEYKKFKAQKESVIQLPTTEEERRIMGLKLQLYYMRLENQRIANYLRATYEMAKGKEKPTTFVMETPNEFPKITEYKNMRSPVSTG